MHFPRTMWLPATLAAAAVLAICWKLGSSGEPRQIGAEPAHSRLNRPPAVTNPVSDTFSRITRGQDTRGNLQTLQQLQEKLRAMPPEEAVAYIQAFFKTGTDKATGLSFKVSKDHTLSEWPTFRTFLMDAILAIDPKAAAGISREILTVPTTADEWSLALRNVGLGDPASETHAYLIERTEALIANPAWQADPSIGYLNSFDVLVHTNATASTPLLSGLIRRKDRKDLAHASFLTLDRLVQQSPAEVLTHLAVDLPLIESRPEMVAQEFARADLRDPAQREILKTWLLDPARTATELRSFAGVYPNNNRFISSNLLTTDTSPSGTDLATHDREALEIIDAWSADPAFESLKPSLATIRQRLTSFVGEYTD